MDNKACNGSCHNPGCFVPAPILVRPLSCSSSTAVEAESKVCRIKVEAVSKRARRNTEKSHLTLWYTISFRNMQDETAEFRPEWRIMTNLKNN